MSHPRIEEVEDSDVEMSDPSEGDIDDFDETDILRARTTPSSSTTANNNPRAHLLNPSQIPSVAAGAPGQFVPPQPTTTTDAKAYAHFHCLYPVYFDATRTRAQGRRVSSALAVPNPLAREIVNACRDLRLQTLFEPEKMHPKDWANPGRVKVAPLGPRAKGQAGGGAGIKNKHQLYLLVAQHLRNNPTTEDSASLWEQIPGGMPAPSRVEEDGKKKGYPRPVVPRGWKVGEFLPYYSPAMTGGGVSENMFKDLMKEMGGAGGMPGGMPGGMDMASLMSAMGGGGGGMPGQGEIEEGSGKKKKEKKGKGKA